MRQNTEYPDFRQRPQPDVEPRLWLGDIARGAGLRAGAGTGCAVRAGRRAGHGLHAAVGTGSPAGCGNAGGVRVAAGGGRMEPRSARRAHRLSTRRSAWSLSMSPISRRRCAPIPDASTRFSSTWTMARRRSPRRPMPASTARADSPGSAAALTEGACWPCGRRATMRASDSGCAMPASPCASNACVAAVPGADPATPCSSRREGVGGRSRRLEVERTSPPRRPGRRRAT